MKTPILKTSILAFLVISSISTRSQIASLGYFDYTSYQKTEIYYDDYSDNRNSWENAATINGTSYVSNGYLTFKSGSDGAAGCIKSLGYIDYTRDFEIEASIKYVSGDKFGAIHLIFGKDPTEWNRYDLGFNGNGSYIIDKSYKNEYTNIVDWTSSSLVYSSSYNVLTVRKVGSTLYYYINWSFVHSTPFPYLYGDVVGFQVPQSTEISVDYIRAYYLGSNSFTQTDYALSASQKQEIFSDTFDSDRFDWTNGATKNGSVFLSGGFMFFESTSKDGAAGLTKNLVNIDQSKDFEIEAEIMFMSGQEDAALMLVFGKDPSEWSRFDLMFSNDGHYKIDKSYKNEYTDIVGWTKSSAVKPNLFNKLTIRKANNKYYFYVNETLVYSMPFQSFYGNDIGFQAPPGTQMGIDKLTISYINGSNNNYKKEEVVQDYTAPLIALYEPYVSENQKISETNKQIVVKGKVTDNSGIYEVLVNGVEASLDNTGNFQQTVRLAVGDNTINIKATDTRNNIANYSFYVNRQAVVNQQQFTEENKQQYQQNDQQQTASTNDKRLALVIGNSKYESGSYLSNPVNDANLMIKTLKNLGFEVVSRVDANKTSMEGAIREFSEKLPNFNIALFYYAGHGVQVDGMNYLIPTNASLNKKEDCKWEAISVNFIIEEFERYPDNTNIVILDACRNDPFRSWSRGGERGFKAIAPTSGTIIAFATSEGATASDGIGSNGLFTQELVKQMVINQPVESVFKKTRVEVEKISKGAQSPQEWSKLKGDFWFKK